MVTTVGARCCAHEHSSARKTERVRFDLSDSLDGAKSIFACMEGQRRAVAERLQEEQAKLERSARPPAGYEVHFVNYDPKSPNNAEVYVEACEEREAASEMEFPPEKNPCPFDNVEADRLFPCEQPSDGLSVVIKSKQGKPLVVSRGHYTHWFETPPDVQVSMLKGAEGAARYLNVKLGRDPDGYSHARTHVALAGHQNGVKHGHMHVDV